MTQSHIYRMIGWKMAFFPFLFWWLYIKRHMRIKSLKVYVKNGKKSIIKLCLKVLVIFFNKTRYLCLIRNIINVSFVNFWAKEKKKQSFLILFAYKVTSTTMKNFWVDGCRKRTCNKILKFYTFSFLFFFFFIS